MPAGKVDMGDISLRIALHLYQTRIGTNMTNPYLTTALLLDE